MEMPPVRLALILDGHVVDVLQTDDRLAAIFLSHPTIVEINQDGVTLNTPYDESTNTFDVPVSPAE